MDQDRLAEAIVREADGKIAGIAAIIRDATERWTADRELRQRLAETERRLAETERRLRELAGDATAGDAGTTAARRPSKSPNRNG
jgi:hypothetical protein